MPDLKAAISPNGAILLGRSFVCDAFAERQVRVVTHAHVDHIGGLRKSASASDRIVATPATMDLISYLYRQRIPSDKLALLDYGQKFEFESEGLALFEAGHIIGSAQVLVEDEEGARIVYTGDFKLPEARVIEADILVMEATYGRPEWTRPFRDKVDDELVRLVREGLEFGPVWIFGYHGKLQEVVRILRSRGVEDPIVLPKRIFDVAKICEKHGMVLGEYFPDMSEEGREAIASNRYIALYHMSKRGKLVGRATRLYLSGWEFDEPCKLVRKDEYVVALSDHSDFEQLLEYVEQSRPKLVIADAYRIGDGKALAREIKKRLGIPAKPMP